MQTFSVAITIALFEHGLAQSVYLSWIFFIYTAALAVVQPYYSPFSFYCDFFTSLGVGSVILVVPLARSNGSLVLVVAVATYAIATFFFLVPVFKAPWSDLHIFFLGASPE